MKLRELFLCAKKTKITLFNNFFFSMSVFDESATADSWGASDAGAVSIFFGGGGELSF